MFEIDDITCNDINMEQLYSLTNFTNSRVGGEYLYCCMKKPLLDDKKLKERDNICEKLTSDTQAKEKLENALSKLGNDKNISVYDCVNSLEKIPQKSVVLNVILSLTLLSLFILMLVLDSKVLMFVFIFMVPVNMIYYFICKERIVKYINYFKFLIRFFNNTKYIVKTDVKHVKDHLSQLSQVMKEFQKIKRFSFCLLAGRKATGGFIDVFLDYLRMLFHVDIIKFYSMLKKLNGKKDSLIRAFDIVGEIDLICSISSFRKSLPYYCKPDFTIEKIIDIEEAYHPYLSKPVSNTLCTKQSVLITGSNATGKSTFIRCIGINAILAQTLYTCTASYYKAPMFCIYSSMSISDNLMNNESYFVSEIKSIKRMFTTNSSNYNLYLIDELLRGTNSKERLIASERILKSLNNQNSFCIVATHDVALTQILSNNFDNYYFNETFENSSISFDYTIKPGICSTTNALKLLKVFDFPKEIWKE